MKKMGEFMKGIGMYNNNIAMFWRLCIVYLVLNDLFFGFITNNIGAMVVGMATDGPVSVMAIHTKANTNSINGMAVECTSGTMDEFTMETLPKTNGMVTESLRGPMELSMRGNLSMDNEKDVENIHLPMEDSMMDRGRMDGTMDLGRVHGKVSLLFERL
jgi:hypothetical protein